jgi:D-alanyl-D-alanine carboxypeptidase/D-alanyl-D-alanine-endopeptidase (penicillin-binding protein 4)
MMARGASARPVGIAQHGSARLGIARAYSNRTAERLRRLVPLRHVPTLILAILACAAVSGAERHDLSAAARSILGSGQGVYIEAADGTVLLAQAADMPVHPASVSKVPTTLALLRKFGPEHRFVTTFAANGPIDGGTLEGDLLVESDGDPNFVDENALLVVEHLNALGVQRVAGNLLPRGTLVFDWAIDPGAVRLREAMSGRVPAAAWAAVRQVSGGDAQAPTSPAPPAIRFVNAAGVATAGSPGPLVERALIVHRSQTLLSLAKSLNDYSNNIFKPLADAAGGATAVESLARSVVPAAMRSEITLGDGAGTDPRNRLSPRAAVKLLRALEQDLAGTGHALTDVLPVAGIDQGTLHDRLNAPEEVGRVVGKTGTFGDYGASALIGAIPTSDRGTVYFAILNHGVPVSEARRRQDRFLHVLLARLHSVPWSYQPDARPAIARAEVSILPE